MTDQMLPTTVRSTARGALQAATVALLAVAAATPFPGGYWALSVLACFAMLFAMATGEPLRIPGIVVLPIVWFGLSLLWSTSPSLTARNMVPLVLASTAVAAATGILGVVDALHSLLTACKILLVACWVTYMFVPAVGRTQELYRTGALEGVFVQRNVAAFFCVVAAISFLSAVGSGWNRTTSPRALGWAGAALVTLLATESGTGLAVFLLAVVVTPVLGRSVHARVHGSRRLAVASVVLPSVALAAWLPFNLDVVSRLFGRDETLTGRSVIWDVVEPVVAQSPWLGHGFGSLWMAGVPITDQMWALAGFPFYHAHSAYLDFLVQVGVVGLTLVVLAMIVTLIRGVRRLTTWTDPAGTWPVALLICLFFYGVDEQAFASQFGWVLLVMAASYATLPEGPGAPRGCTDDPLLGDMPKQSAGRTSSIGMGKGRRGAH